MQANRLAPTTYRLVVVTGAFVIFAALYQDVAQLVGPYPAILTALPVGLGGWWIQRFIQTEMIERRKAKTDLHTQNLHLQLLMRQMPAILWTTDRNLAFTSAAGASLSVLGPNAGELVGMTLFQYFGTEDSAFPPVAAHRRALAGEAVGFDVAWGGHTFQVRVEPFLDEAGAVVGTIGMALDITEQSRTQAALHGSEERFRSAFDHAGIGMALVAASGRCVQVNRALTAMLGYTAEEFQTLQIQDFAHPEDADRVCRLVSEMLDDGRDAVQAEVRYFHKRGDVVWALVNIAAVRDHRGEPLYLINQMQDITDRRRVEEQLLYQADHDALTGLYHRSRFREAMRQVLPSGRGLVLFIDLDGFKQVNDALGHEAGDELLRDVARLMRTALRPGEIMGRLGGDEFAVLLPGAAPERGTEVIRELQEGLRQYMLVVNGKAMTVTASIGVARYPEHGSTPEELLARADLAMYDVKENGRNGHLTYSAGTVIRGLKHEQSLWERRIREALEQDGFELLAQPVLDLSRNQVVWYELLLRMREENGALIPPGDFLDTAERMGLIHAIDRWVAKAAIRHLAARPDLRVSVNLSARSLTNEDLLAAIERDLEATGVCPSRLMLEITETTAVLDRESAGRFIDRLRQAGCQFALDDFGAGFASFHQLKYLPVDCIKIDGNLIRELPANPGDQHVVRAIADMARGLGKSTVAEFVEDEATVRILQECGVTYAQGYHAGRPVRFQELA